MKVAASREKSKPVNEGITEKLKKLGIRKSFDLVLHLPLRFEDETHITNIRHAFDGATVQVEGQVINTEIKYRPRRQLVSQIEDSSGILVVRLLNFYPSQIKQFSVGNKLRLIGEVRNGFFGAEMVHPRYKVISKDTPLPEVLTPIYPTTAGLSQTALQKLISNTLEKIELTDTLPQSLLDKLNFMSFEKAVKFLHRPTPEVALQHLEERTHPAWQRLKFDEFLAQQISMRLHLNDRMKHKAPIFESTNKLSREFKDTLPFPLTNAQNKCIEEIAKDLIKPYPMCRLLQGDVGSGKTLVAAMAALQAIESGYQAVIMAPTEILAEQHYKKLSTLLMPHSVHVTWLTSSLKRKDKQTAIEDIATGVTQLAIGTHALFQEDIAFANLGLAIVDEQHRFGVEQRLALRMKGKGSGPDSMVEPHQLMMSATPIPRTLSMSYYADLDVSVIDELPPGRTPVITKLVDDNRREEVIARVRDACLSGTQAYWVCPLIEESEALQLQTAIDTFETIQATFDDLKVGLIHGRMKTNEKADVMSRFVANEIHLLVATTVIEVGVDVPNASMMVIEHAERMGLSQLHQLRGRVGRGSKSSMCVLLYQRPLSELARARLKVIYESTDGFEIARADLQLRGPGEFLGSRQSGIPMLKFADINTDVKLLELARDAAQWLIQENVAAAREHMERWLGNKEEFLKV